MEDYIIPAKFYQGDLDRLRKSDWEQWTALVIKQRKLNEESKMV